DLQRLRLALAYHAEYQAAARRAAQRTGALGVGRGQRATIHRDDDVAGPDAGLGRGRVVDRRDHAHLAVGQLHDLHADPVVGAAGAFAEGFGRVLVQVGAVRIKVEQQAADRRIHQLAVLDRIDIAAPDRVEQAHVATDFLQRHAGGGALHGVGIVAGAGNAFLRFLWFLPGLRFRRFLWFLRFPRLLRFALRRVLLLRFRFGGLLRVLGFFQALRRLCILPGLGLDLAFLRLRRLPRWGGGFAILRLLSGIPRRRRRCRCAVPLARLDPELRILRLDRRRGQRQRQQGKQQRRGANGHAGDSGTGRRRCALARGATDYAAAPGSFVKRSRMGSRRPRTAPAAASRTATRATATVRNARGSALARE